MGDEPPTTSAPPLMRLVPILRWSRTYDRSWLRGDLIAGIAVAAMIVPKDLGYAGIDIFRFDDAGKIVEHWDVLQVVPDKAENDNGMF